MKIAPPRNKEFVAPLRYNDNFCPLYHASQLHALKMTLCKAELLVENSVNMRQRKSMEVN